MRAPEENAARTPEAPSGAHAITLLYDGSCPLCSKEVRLLHWLDRDRGRVRSLDISAPGFAAERYGLDRQSVFERMHGVLPGGDVVEGLEVFRRAYAAVGLGFVMAPTRWPGLRRLADALYRTFARWRLRRRCRGGPCPVAATSLRPPTHCGDAAAGRGRC